MRLKTLHSYSQEQVCGLDPMTIQEGRWAIAQAITGLWVKARWPGCPHVNPLAQQPFRFDPLRGSPMKDAFGDGGSNHQPSPCQPPRGWEHNRCWRDQRHPSPQFPSPSLDCGRWHQEDRAHININLPVFKDEDAKDAVTYQSWRWDLMCINVQGAWTTLSYPMQLDPCKAILES